MSAQLHPASCAAFGQVLASWAQDATRFHDLGERKRWVSVTGRTTVEDDGARELAVRLAVRYWDLDELIQLSAYSSDADADRATRIARPSRRS